MSEQTSQFRRLKKVAVEFNIGVNSIVRFLESKGIIVESNPNAKINEVGYNLLLNEFQSEKIINEESQLKGLNNKIDKNFVAIEPTVVGKIDIDSLTQKTRPDLEFQKLSLDIFRNIKIEDYIPQNFIPHKHVIDTITVNKNLGLKKLDLSNCGLKEIPKEVFELKHLEELILDNDPNRTINTHAKLGENEISGIQKEISDLTLLKKLSLKNLKIKHLPKQLKFLTNLDYINIDIDAIQTPPRSIINGGISAIRNYFHELKKIDFLYECKLIIVGEGTVGKTSLLKVLTNQDIDFKVGEKSTEGIDIKEWIISKEILQTPKDFKFNVWDFGGQEIYHATHQFFLTKRSLYLFITDATKEDKYADFYYWLNIIKILGNNSPVLIALNKADQRIKDLPINEYKKINPEIKEFVQVSCKNDFRQTILNLTDTIIKNITSSLNIGEPLPSTWVEVRNKLEQWKQEGYDYISYDIVTPILRARISQSYV